VAGEKFDRINFFYKKYASENPGSNERNGSNPPSSARLPVRRTVLFPSLAAYQGIKKQIG
jgi:hypothetical protein